MVGCAYYNGLYNANQLAKEARRAEELGRRGEARSLWLQAAVKAESVVVRYPDSKYRDDALLMQGLALSRTGSCADAVAPLEDAVETSPDPIVRVEAREQLGRCLLTIGRWDSSFVVLTPLTSHEDPERASRARLWRGRAALAVGRPREALADLRATSEPEAVLDRARALLELGAAAAVVALLDSAVTLPYDEELWLDLLSDLAAVDASGASAVVDRLADEGRLTPGESARLFIADGQRWETKAPDRGERRFAAAASVAPDSVEGRLAKALLTIGEIRRANAAEAIPDFVARLDAILRDGSATVFEVVAPFVSVLERAAAARTPSAGTEALLFRAAEEVRDSLLAPRMAAALFGEVTDRYPQSPFAPKAMLAAAATGAVASDSILDILRARYPDSPYTRAAYGLPAPGLEVLEDSLQQLMRPLPSVNPGRVPPNARGGSPFVMSDRGEDRQ
jgi:tetratricopeptide (TPR) repeat protein